ncbi:probable potassium transport system protein kup [Rhodovulum sulfidophilum]|uniref:Probable potassium transport system protein kup n=1 Tax=Rhodovulum sulfidophilum TaxID=35806 RepID=A0A0D6AY40_RHOSU|nr:probable potassium transport system protein kup [Rhodovulum sulfidophilum]
MRRALIHPFALEAPYARTIFNAISATFNAIIATLNAISATFNAIGESVFYNSTRRRAYYYA